MYIYDVRALLCFSYLSASPVFTSAFKVLFGASVADSISLDGKNSAECSAILAIKAMTDINYKSVGSVGCCLCLFFQTCEIHYADVNTTLL